MGEELRGLLDEEIRNEIENLSSLKAGSEEYSAAVEGLAKLYKLKLDDDKIVMEHLENVENHSSDEEFKDAQIKESVKDRYVRIGIAAAELVLPLIFYGIWMKRGFRFEENGTFTSTTFRGLFNRFKPTKK